MSVEFGCERLLLSLSGVENSELALKVTFDTCFNCFPLICKMFSLQSQSVSFATFYIE